MYYQRRLDQVCFQNLREKIETNEGEERWSTDGATVYRWGKSYQHVLRPHRFAVIPQNGNEYDFKMIEPDKYYVHVYQTKLEYEKYDLRTLNSRVMAKELKQRCGHIYWPRPADKKRRTLRTTLPRKTAENRPWKHRFIFYQYGHFWVLFISILLTEN